MPFTRRGRSLRWDDVAGEARPCRRRREHQIAAMAFDLRGALLKKEERESARLADFAFRARTFRLLAETLGLEPSRIVPLIATMDDPAIVEALARDHPGRAPLGGLYDRCRADARAQLIVEEGDPSPHRLA